MTMKVKAVEKKLKFSKDPNDPGVYRYVMSPEQYSNLNQKKVIKEAALRSGVSQGVMQACWDAAGEVIKAWATEGHSVALPGLGTMRFGLRSKSVDDVPRDVIDEVETLGGALEEAGAVAGQEHLLAGCALVVQLLYLCQTALYQLLLLLWGDVSGVALGKVAQQPYEAQ